jgi:hypothetical protein
MAKVLHTIRDPGDATSKDLKKKKLMELFPETF